jgi:uncharacterized protein YndB with AHSA1/START domain
MSLDVNTFKPAIVYTVYIASTPTMVWDALTSAETSKTYFFGNSVDIDAKVGGQLIVRGPDGSIHISGEVIACDPPHRLTVTWGDNFHHLIKHLGRTLVTYEIDPIGTAVRLTMKQSHDRLISDDILSGGRQGWPAILSNLKSVIETGKAMSIKLEQPQRMIEAISKLQ